MPIVVGLAGPARRVAEPGLLPQEGAHHHRVAAPGGRRGGARRHLPILRDPTLPANPVRKHNHETKATKKSI